jgi:superfamily II DNA or RNA helicase
MKLEDLKVDTHVVGIEPAGAVKILYLKQAGADAVDVTYELLNGQVLKKTLFRASEGKLTVESGARVWAFDAKPDTFKLAAEATRIKLAYLFDPMMAVHTSDVDPLPHQISAVYEAMLPKQPLRFVLADDPGAGKTIMAGLLIRELMLRGDLERCLIIAPGSLVEQWQTELSEKFGLRFDLLTNALAESTATGNPFLEHDRIIARLDQLARKEEWQDKLRADGARWDLVVVDEAHKMAVHAIGDKVETTQRFDLGRLIGHPDRTRNLLLMTATPHNGSEEDFQAWLTLVDQDRFLGKATRRLEPAELNDFMRRMVKEDLVKFDGSKLFPDRRAQTINYTLTPAEDALYKAVSDYVREGMNRVDRLEGKKKGMLGFALTILQRRLASSPNAIAQSLRRRRMRLEERLAELRSTTARSRTAEWEAPDVENPDEELTAEELEEVEEELVDEATAARTIPELSAEIGELRVLEQQAEAVLKDGVDVKWDELSKLLQSDAPEMSLPGGRRRKMIIFTEHRDTLVYLKKKIADTLGNPSAVIEMHGGMRRAERLTAQEQFRQNPDVVILIATDAAGEGVNLQVANLMVNYDLPWNPNRIEQRFGRIHRIGQREMCHLWNLVAAKTREGEVFERLFTKLEQERLSLGGKVFDILGESFNDRPLKDLLIEAIRHGDKPEVQAKLFEKVDGALDHQHLQDLLDRNALAADKFSNERLYRVREEMEKAEARKLQPFFLRRFMVEAFRRHGGELKERETGRYEIKHVPAIVRQRHSISGGRRPVLEKYERITFDRSLIHVLHKPAADLVHPAHPLMASLIELVLGADEPALHAGTVLVDPRDPGTTPRLMFMIDHGIREGTTTTRLASRRMQFVEIDADGTARHAGAAPYLDYALPDDGDQPLVEKELAAPWLMQDLSSLALGWASAHLVKEHYDEVLAQRTAIVDKTLRAVHERLTREINHWAKRANELAAEERAGKQPRMQPGNARKRVEELKARLLARTNDLEGQLQIASTPPIIAGAALILPQGLVDEARGRARPPEADPEVRRRVELTAMNAVIEAEAALGHATKDVSAEKCGWDITAIMPDGGTRHIEVKGRHVDADTVTVTANEVLEALNQGDKFFLAIVRVDGGTIEGPHYIRAPFTTELESSVVSVNYSMGDLLRRSTLPHLTRARRDGQQVGALDTPGQIERAIERLRAAGLTAEATTIVPLRIQGGLHLSHEGGIRLYAEPFVLVHEAAGKVVVRVAGPGNGHVEERADTLSDAVDALIHVYELRKATRGAA